MICFHHNDADGRCGAAIVALAYRKKVILNDDYPLAFEEMDYNRPLPLSRIGKNETVVIVDFSFKPLDMAKILLVTEQIIWIDHHKTAEAYDYGFDPLGLRCFDEPGKSGALLAWEYFFRRDGVPVAIRLVSDYDTWQHKMAGDREFNLGLMAQEWCADPSSGRWENLFGNPDFVRQLSDAGQTITLFRDSKCEDYCSSFGYETDIAGHKAFAVNLYTFGSHTFGARMKEYDICAGFVHDGYHWTVSLYSDRGVDTSVISKSHGGGGHSAASGFQCKELPFKKGQPCPAARNES